MRGRKTVPMAGVPGKRGTSLDEMVSAYETMLIMETLAKNGWNRGRSAGALQISRRRLSFRMRKLGFDLKALPHDKPGRKKRQMLPTAA